VMAEGHSRNGILVCIYISEIFSAVTVSRAPSLFLAGAGGVSAPCLPLIAKLRERIARLHTSRCTRARRPRPLLRPALVVRVARSHVAVCILVACGDAGLFEQRSANAECNVAVAGCSSHVSETE